MFFRVFLVAFSLFCFSGFSVDFVHASERSKKVCAKRLEDKSIRKGYYALAISSDREHCGWSWGNEAKKYAEISALNNCKKFKGAACKIVLSGCNPHKLNTCGK
ncbi:DUF4189 domain-containing protein [uncultured Roseibium sp.]|uniref:DUF4189 domain-containing protein n=1 Tax=uncultured Roseibium sp. TaxID=1936171 RepID=UPI00345C893E